MAELQYDENNAPKRDFPVSLAKGDQKVLAHTEADVVNAEWNGFKLEESKGSSAAKSKDDDKK